MAQPIDVYFWPTPNGNKITIFLEEAGLPYNIIPINIGAGDQFKEEFLEFSPNNKMPAIIDPEGPDGQPISIFESGAILVYLGEKTSKFLPVDARSRYRTIEWLMFQMGGVGPMLGQNHHFRQYAPEKIEYAIDRYTNEATRLYNVIDKRLENNEFIAGGEYTIADMAIWPWLTNHENQGQDLGSFPNLARWYWEMDARPAVKTAMEKGKKVSESGLTMDDAAKEQLFGGSQYQRR
ncbi:MAG: glutathione S-transferase family protein [Rubrobacter sp.]|jgi:GST-like protein|nr:glutathione S-transferase family protein [Rubrobacter sp.]